MAMRRNKGQSTARATEGKTAKNTTVAPKPKAAKVEESIVAMVSTDRRHLKRSEQWVKDYYDSGWRVEFQEEWQESGADPKQFNSRLNQFAEEVLKQEDETVIAKLDARRLADPVETRILNRYPEIGAIKDDKERAIAIAAVRYSE